MKIKILPIKLGFAASSILALIALSTLIACYLLTESWAEKFYNRNYLHTRQIIIDNLSDLVKQPLILNDVASMQKLIDKQLLHNELFSIEVTNNKDQIIYRKDKFNIDSDYKKLERFQVELIDDRTGIDMNDFNNSIQKPYLFGKMNIVFQREEINKTLQNQLYGHYMIFFIIVGLAIFIMHHFMKTIRNQVVNIKHAMEQISNDEIPQINKKSNFEEFDIIDESLLTLGKTVKDTKNELLENIVSLNKAKLEAQKMANFREDFIKSISHDIRSPAGVINSLLKLIKEDIKESSTLSKLGEKHINVCFNSSTILCKIIDELFDYEQFSDDAMTLNEEPLNISEWFNGIAGLYDIKAKERNLAFTVIKNEKIHNNDIEYINIDTGKITRVIDNLLDNAFKYTKQGSVCLIWAASHEKLSIEIKDSGIGIEEQLLDPIFEKYVQGIKPEYARTGLGLGLFYVKKYVAFLSGTLKIKSLLNVGTTISIEIPVVDYKMKSATANEYLSLPASDKIYATIIDDSVDNCHALASTLAKLGVESESHQIPELGYHALEKRMPSLIFVDYHMEGMCGDELAAKIQNESINYSPDYTAIICITADVSAKTHAKLKNGTFDHIITKPVTREDLECIILSIRKTKLIGQLLKETK